MITDHTIAGLITHLELHELSARRALAHTRKCIRVPGEGASPREYYERMLPLRAENHAKWKGWLDAVRKPKRKK